MSDFIQISVRITFLFKILTWAFDLFNAKKTPKDIKNEPYRIVFEIEKQPNHIVLKETNFYFLLFFCVFEHNVALKIN